MSHSSSLPLIQGEGFILSRQVLRRGGREHIVLWLATEEGPVCIQTPVQQPVCFVPREDSEALRKIAARQNIPLTLTDNNLVSLEQTPMLTAKVNLESQLSALRTSASDAGIALREADIRLADRYLMERFIYGSLQFQGARGQNAVIRNVRTRPSAYKPKLKCVSIDIECDEHEQLFSVGLATPELNIVLLITPHDQPPPQTDAFTLVNLNSEQDLLTALNQKLAEIDPDILLGWNVKQFDIAVLSRRYKENGVPMRWGRDGSQVGVMTWSNGQTLIDIAGRSVVDGIESLKTMTYHFDSFSLNDVASELLGETKLIHEDNQLEAIKQRYFHAPLSLAQYNLKDCQLVNAIAVHTRFVDFLVLRASLTGLELSRPGGSVAAFLNVYLPKLHRDGYVAGLRPASGGLASPGGYVMTSKPGLYNHVLVLDFKSLYPSIIRTFFIDPMGLAEGLKNPGEAIEGFNGACFARERHHLPQIISSLWAQRDEAKKDNDGPRSQAIKILMNSFYGILGSGGCPFYDPRLASSITLRGHEIMQTTAQWIEDAGYEVIYGDTDSTFVNLPSVSSHEEASLIGRKLEAMINTRWHQQLAQRYQIDCHLEIEFETHFAPFFMPTIRGAETGSKKRYAGLKQHDKGETLIFKGLETVRSDWTALAKQFQQTLYLRVFKHEPVEELVRETVERVRRGDLDHDLVYSRRLRKPLADYTKNVPPHVRAARAANASLQAQGKAEKYINRQTIRYVMTVNGPQTVEWCDAPLDYDHYVEKQLRPIAESILGLINLDFDTLTNDQLGLF